MEELIEQFLFQHKICPLPSVGSLQIKEGTATAWHGDNKLSAPVPEIEFSNVEIPAEHFIAFIAAQRNIPIGEASVSLQKYCLGLQKLKEYAEIKLAHAGKFYIDQSGKLVFKQDPLPKEFFPSIRFQRVSHAKHASHSIRVGDTETTNEVMTEYYSEKLKVKKEKWWIPALILAVAATAILFFYFSEHKYNENFGNIQPVSTSPAPQTYR